MRGEVGGRKLDFDHKKPKRTWQKAALRPERCVPAPVALED